MFCRFCGKELLNDSVFCSYCGKKLDGGAGASALDDDFGKWNDFFESAVNQKRQADQERRAAIEKARALIVMGRTQPAIEEYDALIEKDPADVAGYIGFIRAASGNFSNFDGSVYHQKLKTYIGVRDYVNRVAALLNGRSSGDAEYDAFLQRMQAADREKERQRLAAEAEAKRRREEEEERKRRELEELERRKPIELAEAKKSIAVQYGEKKWHDAYQSCETVLRLSTELGRTLPSDFRSYFEPLCRMLPKNARKNEQSMEYFKRFADAGDANAQYTLGVLYYDGSTEYVSVSYGGGGYDRHPEEHLASAYFKKAIDNGSADAMIRTGDSHFNSAKNYDSSYGDDMEKRRECYLQAVYWYQKAAATGSAAADNKLAHCYRYGYGVAQDLDRAIALYKKTNSYDILGDIYAAYPKNELTTAIMYYKHVDRFYKIAALYEKLGRKSDAIEYYRKVVETDTFHAAEAQKRIAVLMYG